MEKHDLIFILLTTVNFTLAGIGFYLILNHMYLMYLGYVFIHVGLAFLYSKFG